MAANLFRPTDLHSRWCWRDRGMPARRRPPRRNRGSDRYNHESRADAAAADGADGPTAPDRSEDSMEAAEPLSASSRAAAPPEATAPGGSRELLALAAPLIVSQSFMTVQVFLDTVLLAWHDRNEMA